MNAILTKTLDGKTVNIFLDQDPESPRAWDNLGEILYLTDSRYTLGDKAVEMSEIHLTEKSSEYIYLPVYAYIHGSIVLSTKPFSCRWDSGQVGIIRVLKSDVRKAYNVQRITVKTLDKVLSVLKSEIETYSKYLNGEVYGFEVLDAQGEHIDSCWGFYEEPETLANEALKGNL